MAANIFSEIHTWSKQLAPWQNEAIRKLFAKGVLSASDKDELFDLAQIEFGLLPRPTEAVDLMLKSSELPTPPSAGKQIKLKKISKVSEVNVLKSDEFLTIGSQLTIIYGENGAGKSGYARIMKQAFRARAVDPVLPNVYAKRSGVPPSAVFDIEEGGVVREEKWTDGAPSPACLGRFAVFDGKCARVYINNDNQLGFLPYGFDILDGVGAITGEVKKRFQDLASTAAPKADSLRPLIDTTATGKMLAALTATTPEADVRAKALWSESDARELSEKEIALAKLKATSPQLLRTALDGKRKQIITVRDSANSVFEIITDEKMQALRAKVAELVTFEAAVNAAAKATFGDISVAGIGGEVWRELLFSAAKFSTEVVAPGQPFPSTSQDAKCVLCLRVLDSEAHDRLRRFWAFIEDDVSSKRDKAKKALGEDMEKLRKLPRTLPKEVAVLEESLRVNGSAVFDKAKGFFASAGLRIAALERAVAENTWDTVPAVPANLGPLCESELAAVGKELTGIGDDGKVAEAIKSLSEEIAELNARKRLTENLPLVLDHLNGLKKAAKANLAYSKITTNGISSKASDLQTKFVTEAFRKKVQEELAPLNLIRVKAGIDKRSEKGKVLHKLTIDGAASVSLEGVFSEGERTALSISCFLAELSASDDNCGIIFDDPVSSLDHRVREAIVNRLVKEASLRQVIIFTHDLVFHRELSASAEVQKIDVAFQNVEALGGITGIISDLPPWTVTKVAQRIGFLDQLLKKAKEAEAAANVPGYKSAFREFYSSLRSTWERSVEELLFNQVVQRYEKEVRTMRLTDVNVDNEAVAAVFKGMTRASTMIDAHDHATAEQPSLPTSGELAKDLDEFKAFRTQQKAKSEAAGKANAHLK